MPKIVTMFELQKLTRSELESLHRTVSAELARSRPGSPERRNALASLDNISWAIVAARSRGNGLRP